MNAKSPQPSYRLPDLLLLAGLLLPAAAAIPAEAIQVQFNLSDKMGAPVAGARICLAEDTSQCRTTDAQGKSLFSPTVGIPPAAAAPGGAPSFAVRPGFLIIETSRPMRARLSMYAVSGRRLGPGLALGLRPGRTLLPWPKGISGLAFFRLDTESGSARFGAVNEPGPSPRLAALAKAAAANLHAFAISKSGYQGFVYRPRKENDTASIRLAADGDTGIPYVGIIRARLAGIDSAGHSLQYAYTQETCDGATPVSREQTATLPFWIREGRWYFPAGNCYGVALGKSGDGIFGLWKSLGLVPLPPGLFPVACDPSKDSLVTSVPNLFFLDEGGGWDIDLGSDSLTIRIRRRACPGNQLIVDPAALDGQDGRPELLSNTCTEVKLRNSRDETATYSYPVASDSLKAVYTYGGATCATAAVPLVLDAGVPKSCPEAQAAALMADTAWQACVKASGFVQ